MSTPVSASLSHAELLQRYAVSERANESLSATLAKYKERTVNIAALVSKYKELEQQHTSLQAQHKQAGKQLDKAAADLEAARAKSSAKQTELTPLKNKLRKETAAKDALAAKLETASCGAAAAQAELSQEKARAQQLAKERDELVADTTQSRSLAQSALEQIEALRAEFTQRHASSGAMLATAAAAAQHTDVNAELAMLRQQVDQLQQQQEHQRGPATPPVCALTAATLDTSRAVSAESDSTAIHRESLSSLQRAVHTLTAQQAQTHAELAGWRSMFAAMAAGGSAVATGTLPDCHGGGAGGGLGVHASTPLSSCTPARELPARSSSDRLGDSGGAWDAQRSAATGIAPASAPPAAKRSVNGDAPQAAPAATAAVAAAPVPQPQPSLPKRAASSVPAAGKAAKRWRPSVDPSQAAPRASARPAAARAAARVEPPPAAAARVSLRVDPAPPLPKRVSTRERDAGAAPAAPPLKVLQLGSNRVKSTIARGSGFVFASAQERASWSRVQQSKGSGAADAPAVPHQRQDATDASAAPAPAPSSPPGSQRVDALFVASGDEAPPDTPPDAPPDVPPVAPPHEVGMPTEEDDGAASGAAAASPQPGAEAAAASCSLQEWAHNPPGAATSAEAAPLPAAAVADAEAAAELDAARVIAVAPALLPDLLLESAPAYAADLGEVDDAAVKSAAAQPSADTAKEYVRHAHAGANATTLAALLNAGLGRCSAEEVRCAGDELAAQLADAVAQHAAPDSTLLSRLADAQSSASLAHECMRDEGVDVRSARVIQRVAELCFQATAAADVQAALHVLRSLLAAGGTDALADSFAAGLQDRAASQEARGADNRSCTQSAALHAFCALLPARRDSSTPCTRAGAAVRASSSTDAAACACALGRFMVLSCGGPSDSCSCAHVCNMWGAHGSHTGAEEALVSPAAAMEHAVLCAAAQRASSSCDATVRAVGHAMLQQGARMWGWPADGGVRAVRSTASALVATLANLAQGGSDALAALQQLHALQSALGTAEHAHGALAHTARATSSPAASGARSSSSSGDSSDSSSSDDEDASPRAPAHVARAVALFADEVEAALLLASCACGWQVTAEVLLDSILWPALEGLRGSHSSAAAVHARAGLQSACSRLLTNVEELACGHAIAELYVADVREALTFGL